MRQAPIGILPDWFVSYEDSKGRYTEVNFERKTDALKFIARLKKMGVAAELWTRTRTFPEVRT